MTPRSLPILRFCDSKTHESKIQTVGWTVYCSLPYVVNSYMFNSHSYILKRYLGILTLSCSLAISYV